MLASLAGGASCGPSNPLQQLSKSYAADRGAQQDHYAAPQAGPPGQSAFRNSASRPDTTDPAAQQFFQHQPGLAPSAASSHQPFNLAPLGHALPQAGPSTPAWAHAFVSQQHQPTSGASAAEQERFARAFNRPGPSAASPLQRPDAPAWVGDFHAHAQGSAQQRADLAPSSSSHATAPTQYHPAHQQNALSRLQGQGFGTAPMVNYLRDAGPAPSMSTHVGPATAREHEGKAEWDQAFLARESDSTPDLVTDASGTTTDFSSHLHETRPLTPPLRAHSPGLENDTAARDALARTAANLLSTVRSAEEQRLRGLNNAASTLTEAIDTDADAVGAKFAQSSFMQLMRQLRDGQVAVEGDQVVDVPAGAATSTAAGKGKARADGWTSDFAATSSSSAALHEAFDREEEGRANPAAPPVLRPGQSVESHAHEQHAWARDQAVVRELEEGYQMMHGLWDDEDRERAARERSRAKGKERAPFVFQGDGGNLIDSDGEPAAAAEAATRVPLAQSSWEEDFDDPSMIVGGHALGGGIARRPDPSQFSAQQREWDALQHDWDTWDATATGFRNQDQEVERLLETGAVGHGYAFAQNNPFAMAAAAAAQAASSSTTRQHAHHSQAGFDDLTAALSERHESLLQREADVLREPTNASAWLSLGLKQQQNEREELAIAALRRATELDPLVSDGAAHLALAVSYTNEGRRTDAYEQLNRWVDAVAESDRVYGNEIEQYRNLFGARLPGSISERQVYLSNLLIRLAQSRAEHGQGADGVDADVQVALGVLFNSSEEYEKASDCFEAALSVRPDDPLLFNRLGATYANSGNTDAAMQYYLAALDRDPGYVRARYNLAVASMNIGKHEDAVHHLLTSLSIQEADTELDHLQQGPPPSVESGHVSHALWDMLHVSLLQMHRSDLAPLAAAHDLRALLTAFTKEA
ncbi:hypothetical protein JCM8202_005254 [Rhodotorula sphaerocarpa]